MDSPDTASSPGLIARLKRLEARLDAWAATKLSPEEYAEAVAMDGRLKRNFGRWSGMFAVMVLAFALLVAGAWPQLGFGRALLISGLGGAYLLMLFVSVWYGWTRYTKRPAWMVFSLFLLILLAGAVTGFVLGTFERGRSLSDLQPEKLMRAMAGALAIGVLLAGAVVGIARMRLREMRAKAALMEAAAQREKLERQGVQAELKLLQAQVEPHFLFNTLANLRYLVQTGSQDALPMLDHLVHYLRTALPEMRSDSSTLGREAELARAYLGIMRLRMGGALAVAVEVPASLVDVPFPPLMVITLVENAIKHGVGPVGRGQVTLRAAERGGRLRVEVHDDGRGIAGSLGRGVGLANIRERLQALHGEDARLSLEAREGGGTIAAIEIPRPVKGSP
jgi:signal transduction histidine kinase